MSVVIHTRKKDSELKGWSKAGHDYPSIQTEGKMTAEVICLFKFLSVARKKNELSDKRSDDLHIRF